MGEGQAQLLLSYHLLRSVLATAQVEALAGRTTATVALAGPVCYLKNALFRHSLGL